MESRLVIELELKLNSPQAVSAALVRLTCALQAAVERSQVYGVAFSCTGSLRRLTAEVWGNAVSSPALSAALESGTSLARLVPEVPDLVRDVLCVDAASLGWNQRPSRRVMALDGLMVCLDAACCPMQVNGVHSVAAALGSPGAPRIDWLGGDGYRSALATHGIVIDAEQRRGMWERLLQRFLSERGMSVSGSPHILQRWALGWEHLELRLCRVACDVSDLPDFLVREIAERHDALCVFPGEGMQAVTELCVLVPIDYDAVLSDLEQELTLAKEGYAEAQQRGAQIGGVEWDAAATRAQGLLRAIGTELGLSPQVIEAAVQALRAVPLGEAPLLVKYPAIAGLLAREILERSGTEATTRRLLLAYVERKFSCAAPSDAATDEGAEIGQVGTAAALVFLVNHLLTVVRASAQGQLPAGPSDPFAARSAGANVIQVLLDKQWQLSLTRLARLGCAGVELEFQLSVDAAEARALGFLRHRMRVLLGEDLSATDAQRFEGGLDVPTLRARSR